MVSTRSSTGVAVAQLGAFASPSADVFTGASYTATFAYDNVGRLTAAPAGASYTSGDPAHPHAVTATTDGHSYSYDAAGNVRCRAIASGGCTGPSPTGALYTADNEGRQTPWAYKPSGATATASELYDGSGERVARQTTPSGVLTSSVYVGPLAEEATTGSTTTTDYFVFGGQTIAIRDTAWHDLVADQLGSPVVQLNASGNPGAGGTQAAVRRGALCGGDAAAACSGSPPAGVRRD